MKKILLTLALAFCCAAGQGQTTAKPADVNIQELNTKWAKFTQYAEQKQIKGQRIFRVGKLSFKRIA